MSITLGSNIASLRAQRKLAESSKDLGSVFERLSSGQRINRASEVAAGLADALRVDSRLLNQGIRNLNDGLSLLNIADKAIENLSAIVLRLEELAVLSANGAYTNKQRKALDGEAQSLSDEFFRISKTTEFNGQKLFTGENPILSLQAGRGEDAVLLASVGGAIGSGEFVSNGTFPAGNFTSAAAPVDFNADGFLDIIAANQLDNTVSLLLGSGNGSFATAQSFATGTQPRALSTGDFNGDGIFDIVTVGSNAASVLLGDGNGSFVPASSFPVGNGARGVATGDVNGDGLVDIVSANTTDNTVSVLLGTGNGDFQNAGTFSTGYAPRAIILGDFSGDGKLDLATADYSADTVSILRGAGDGSFGAAISFVSGNGPDALHAGDFNGDGALDIVAANYAGASISVFMGLGNGTLGSVVTLAAGFIPWAVEVGDFNGDGNLDVVSANYGSQNVSVFLGSGKGSFQAANNFAVPNGPRSVSTGDFIGDGILDIFTTGYFSGGASVLIGSSRAGVAPLLDFSLKTIADSRQAASIFNSKRAQLAQQRAEIGSNQRRIEVASHVLTIASENFKAAESRIRNADIAGEAANLTRLNILQQAASSILAQANQQPALALQLL